MDEEGHEQRPARDGVQVKARDLLIGALIASIGSYVGELAVSSMGHPIAAWGHLVSGGVLVLLLLAVHAGERS
jgi:hypothetical protein